MRIAVIVPVYNEEKRAIDTVKKIIKVFDGRIIIVNDGSSDNSLTMLKKNFSNNENVIILDHVVNLGKGAAMKTGASKAWKMGVEAVVFVDADGQHNPKHLPKFAKKLEKFPLVFGYRNMNIKMPFVRKWGNIIALNMVGALFNIKRKDLLCGYLGFRKSVYRTIKWKSPRYGIETEMATKVGKNRLAFCEVKVDTIYIDKYKGVSILDAFKILTQIPFWYFSK